MVLAEAVLELLNGDLLPGWKGDLPDIIFVSYGF